MKIVLDTNVLVSSTLVEHGKPYGILKRVESGKIKLFLSPEIIKELEDVLLRDKIPFEENEVREFIEKIISISCVIKPKEQLKVVDEDPDDDKILECAIESEADYVVSGDPHLLDLGLFKGIKILSPDEFLNIVKD